jgi:hypothetical protein
MKQQLTLLHVRDETHAACKAYGGVLSKLMRMQIISGSSTETSSAADTVLRVTTLACAALVVVMYLTYGIDRPLWLDEANTVHIAKGSPGQIIEALSLDVSPPLYYFILGGWIRIAGDSEIAVRIPSILFYLSGIYVASRLGRMLFSPDCGWLAAFVYAVSPVAGRQAQNARMYTLLALVSGLSLMVFFILIRDKHRRTPAWFALFGLIAFVGLNTHYWFVFVLAAYATWILLAVRSWRLRELTMLAAFTVVPFAIINLRMFLQQEALPAADWTPQPGLYSLAQSVLAHFGLIPPTSIRSVVTGLLLISPFAIWAAKQGSRRLSVKHGRTLLFAVCIYFITIGLPFLISLRKPIFWPGRYDTIALPFFSLCLAGMLLQLSVRTRTVLQLLLAASCFIYFFGAVRASSSTAALRTIDGAPLGDRPAGRAICAEAAPGDYVIYTGLSRASISYYLQRFGCAEKVNQVSFPAEIAQHMGWLHFGRDYSAERRFQFEAASISERAGAPESKIFVLVHPDTKLSGPIIEAIVRRSQLESSRKFVSCRMCFRELRVYRSLR